MHSSLATALVLTAVVANAQEDTYQPRIAPASEQARAAMARFRLAPGLEVELFAAEPLLANPVAFHVDARGVFYVCETFRLHHGVTDNRSHTYWIDDDLACRTVADRVAKYAKHLGDGFADYAVAPERIRCVFDDDGDGTADRATVFADGFTDPADGIAAGVLATGDGVYYTCIPNLWKLDDADRDGVADQRQVLLSGFGVHTALLGHDMHGLCFGPDGRLYFSIGDRGFSVRTREGALLAYPDEGAVLRCEPDGSDLEVFASGLRNPQELVFDRWGNLFTGDNNSDGGDQARWVHVVEGGDSGWRMSFQYLNDRGPWNQELLWKPAFDGQAAWIVPPVANLASGPSGVTVDPGGAALPRRYADHFFLCDFRGASQPSGIRALSVVPKGASFELDNHGELVWHVLATDVDFAPDGGLYLSDWTEGWGQPGKGRIYRLRDRSRDADPLVRETAALLSQDLEAAPAPWLVGLLGHADQRVRQRAQFALAARGATVVDALVAVALAPDDRQARVHALWALGQVARREPAVDVATPLLQLLGDGDAEVRAQAARVAGDVRPMVKQRLIVVRLTPLLHDPSARVVAEAALALGKLRAPTAVPAVLEMLEANADRDPVLRHAGVMALTGCAGPATLHELAVAAGRSPAERMALLLALRRHRHPGVGHFLADPEPRLVVEAARAIHDVPIETQFGALAAVLERAAPLPDALVRRAVSAGFRLGTEAAAARLAAFAADPGSARAQRVLALHALRDWQAESGRDRVLGLWRPLPERSVAPAREALGARLEELCAGPQAVAVAAVEAAARLQPLQAAAQLGALVRGDAPVAVRAAALAALADLAAQDPPRVAADELAELVALAAGSESEPLRQRALTITAALSPARAAPVLAALAEQGAVAERRHALELLGGLGSPAADAVLRGWVERLTAGTVPPELALDVLLAAEARGDGLADVLAAYRDAKPDDPLAPYSEALAGGDPAAGKVVFETHPAATCLRCHQAGADGGVAGPPLAGVGARRSPRELLASLVSPNATIAEGYGTVVVSTRDGSAHAGAARFEDDRILRLEAEGLPPVEIDKRDILSRTDPVSAMPPMATILDPRQLRDVVAYLASLR